MFCYSVIKVLCVLFLRHNFFILSHSEVFVKNFFLFCCFFLSKTACTFYHSLSRMSSTFFVINNHNGEEGIWTLAPLLTTYSLSRRAPSASWVLLQIVNKTYSKRMYKPTTSYLNRWYGEGGIRTHGTFQYHWFSRPAP